MAEDSPHSAFPPAIDAAGARLLARFFTAGRPALCQVYTEMARRSAGGLRDFKIVTLGRHETGAAFAAALMETVGTGTHRTFLTELANLGFFDLPKALDALTAATAAKTSPLNTLLWPQDASGLVIEPEGWNKTMSRTLDMAALLLAVNTAARRVCLLEHGTHQGSGFLIGPQTVLTNWHVMEPLVDPITGQPHPDSAAKISCTFESLTGAKGKAYPVAESWLVDFRPMSGPQPLDFCAVRLLDAPGRERGWYDLSRTGSLNSDDDHFFVFQHPRAFKQRLGISTRVSIDPVQPHVLRHKTWTDNGSSGGLCLDNGFQPLALHHAAVTNGTITEYNRAIRLSAIHAANPGLGAPDPALDRITLLSDGTRAVLGRGQTQDLVQAMMRDGDRPILYVRGDPQSGKSFTADLIRDCTAHDRRRIVRLSALEVPAGAHDLAQLILRRAGAAPAVVDALAQPDTPNGTDASRIRDTLWPALRNALTALIAADPAQPMILWLVIDDLGQVAIPQTGARELLDVLYLETRTMPGLRVALIGLNAPLTGVDPATTRTDHLESPDQIGTEMLETCLGQLMTLQRLTSAPTELTRQARLLEGVEAMLRSAGSGRNRLERLSDILAQVWVRAVQRWT